MQEYEKKVVSANLPKPLVEAIDDSYDNRSDAIADSLWEQVMDEDLYEKRIEREKAKRDELMAEKQRIERELEESRDKIRELEDKKTEIRALGKAREAINEAHIQNLRNLFEDWRSEWKKGDPRAPSKLELIERKAERISEHKGVEKKRVQTVLRAKLGC